MKTLLLPTVLIARTALAAPSARHAHYAVKETHNPPPAWNRLDVKLPADQVLDMTIGLKQSNFGKLDEHLSKSSNPSHAQYGVHLSAEQVNAMVAPTSETLDAVREWLNDHGIDLASLKHSPAKDFISVPLTLGKAEELLNTKYHLFEHSSDGDRLIRAPSWSLPRHLHEHIDLVQPTNSFFRPTRQRSLAMPVVTPGVGLQHHTNTNADVGDVSAVCTESYVTPACLRTVYGTINYTAQASGNNSMGLNNFLGEVNNRSDTSLFLKQFRPEAAAAAYDFKTVVINGGNNNQGQENATRLAASADIEGNLDSETMLGIAWPTKLTTFNTGGTPPFMPDTAESTVNNEPYLDWLNAVLSQDDLPYVISSSYADDEQTVPQSYAQRVCQGFAQLGARGISLFFGSGDSGVGAPGTCQSNDGNNTSTFLALFPASCPYVTTVGATRGFNPEIVAFDTSNGFVSGGGFSRYFARPSYQDSVVPDYVKSLGAEFAGQYNPDGRGYPDVAAQGYRFAVVWNGNVMNVDGTSAATPAFAAVVALVNDALLAAGRPVLGFLNPFLYSHGFSGLTDVTKGSATGCGFSGFPAVQGWDAVTGFGTPNFGKMVDLAKQAKAQ